MRALVTGGAGFIGSNIVKMLVEKGIEVTVLDNLSTGYQKNLTGLPVKLLTADIRDRAAVEIAVKNVDWIFHLAANIGNVKSLNNPQEDSEINVLGTLNLLEAARRASVKRVIYSSSASIFGELRTMPIAESHSLNPDSPYGVSKLAAEKHTLCYGILYDIEVVALRYFNVYGPHQRYDAYGNVIPIFAERLCSRQPLTIYGDGQQTRDFITVTDVAKANYLAATRAPSGAIYNLGSGTTITINHLAELLQSASEIKAKAINFAPPRPAEVRDCCADISKAVRELGFIPDSNIEAGLRQYMKWFINDRT